MGTKEGLREYKMNLELDLETYISHDGIHDLLFFDKKN